MEATSGEPILWKLCDVGYEILGARLSVEVLEIMGCEYMKPDGMRIYPW